MEQTIYQVLNESSGSWLAADRWVVLGPGTYIQFRDHRTDAFSMAARLNNAYMLGYATKIIDNSKTGEKSVGLSS